MAAAFFLLLAALGKPPQILVGAMAAALTVMELPNLIARAHKANEAALRGVTPLLTIGASVVMGSIRVVTTAETSSAGSQPTMAVHATPAENVVDLP